MIPDTLQTTERYQVVYLLHGLSGNVDDWGDGSQVWLLAKAYNLIFVIPEVQRSFTDMAFGPAYYTYISQELPLLYVKSCFRFLLSVRTPTLWGFPWAAMAR